VTFIERCIERNIENEEDEDEDPNKLYHMLDKLSHYNLAHREQHRVYQEKIRRILTQIDDKLDNLEFKSKHYINELEKIQAMCKTSETVIYDRSNKNKNNYFNFEEDIVKNSEAAAGNKLEYFFNQFDPKKANRELKREQVKAMHQEKKILKKNFSIYGKFPLHFLKQKKVLVDIMLKGEKIEKLFKKSSLIFYDDGDMGLKVNLVYVEKSTVCSNLTYSCYCIFKKK
jgi:FtsZ-binding cell division protein ZapB